VDAADLLRLRHADWYVKFKITDASTSGNGTQQPDPTYVMCFGPTVESLPRFEYGNIIRLHRAKVSAQEIATGSIRSQLVLQVGWKVCRALRGRWRSFPLLTGDWSWRHQGA
jgi:hypothetical protein